MDKRKREGERERKNEKKKRRRRKANEQFFVGAQTVICLLQIIQNISDIYFITDHVAYASSNKTKIVCIETDLFYFTRGGCVSCLRACLGAWLVPQSYPGSTDRNLSEGADRVGGQLRGGKECPFSGVTKSGRVWRKVPESDARSVHRCMDSWAAIKSAPSVA